MHTWLQDLEHLGMRKKQNDVPGVRREVRSVNLSSEAVAQLSDLSLDSDDLNCLLDSCPFDRDS